MPETLIVEQIEPIQGDTYETADFARCDCCGESACNDIWAGELDESKWRAMYRIVGDGCIVCENCLPDVELPEKPHA